MAGWTGGWTAGQMPSPTITLAFTGLEIDVEVLATGEDSAVADLMTGGGMEGALGGPEVTEKEVSGLGGTEKGVLGLEGIAKGALGLLGSERGALGTGIDRTDLKKGREWCECSFLCPSCFWEMSRVTTALYRVFKPNNKSSDSIRKIVLLIFRPRPIYGPETLKRWYCNERMRRTIPVPRRNKSFAKKTHEDLG